MKCIVVALLGTLAFFPACQSTQSEQGAKHAHMWAKVNKATATLSPVGTKNAGISGTITFVDVEGGVKVEGTINGLAPKSTHAFHIHEFGDISGEGGMAAGAHYNPEGHHHGAPDAPVRHAGDLGNVTADEKGVARVNVMMRGISVAGMTNPVLGRGVVLHEGVDDLKTDPTGNAGGRIAVGVIGVAKSDAKPTVGTRPVKR